METKICIRCEIEKSKFKFSQVKNKKDGFNNTCKLCMLDTVRKWRLENNGKPAKGRWTNTAFMPEGGGYE